jgi:TPR repeat protein
VRIAFMVGGAVVAVAAAVLFVILRFGRDNRGERGHPTAASAAPSEGAMDARRLGLRLLAISDPEEVRAGMASLSKSAEQGNVEAEVALGRIYFKGHPAIPKDTARAREWFVRAAGARHPTAAYFLGVMSQSGEGAAPDPAEAARWFEIAANAGSSQAMFLLANAYRVGAGVPQNNKKAIELYERAGEMEHPAALQALSMAYLYGELGLAPDDATARMYSMEAEHAIRHPPVQP